MTILFRVLWIASRPISSRQTQLHNYPPGGCEVLWIADKSRSPRFPRGVAPAFMVHVRPLWLADRLGNEHLAQSIQYLSLALQFGTSLITISAVTLLDQEDARNDGRVGRSEGRPGGQKC